MTHLPQVNMAVPSSYATTALPLAAGNCRLSCQCERKCMAKPKSGAIHHFYVQSFPIAMSRRRHGVRICGVCSGERRYVAGAAAQAQPPDAADGGESLYRCFCVIGTLLHPQVRLRMH